MKKTSLSHLFSLFHYLSQSKTQRVKQAVDVIIREKEKNSAPTIIAPMTLVAANVTARRITENSIVPRIPTNSAESGVHLWLQIAHFCVNAEVRRVTAR